MNNLQMYELIAFLIGVTRSEMEYTWYEADSFSDVTRLRGCEQLVAWIPGKQMGGILGVRNSCEGARGKLWIEIYSHPFNFTAPISSAILPTLSRWYCIMTAGTQLTHSPAGPSAVCQKCKHHFASKIISTFGQWVFKAHTLSRCCL
jgi:hypothetical protein